MEAKARRWWPGPMALTVPRCTAGSKWLDNRRSGRQAASGRRTLVPNQLPQLETLLLQGAKSHGWSTDLWTCQRVVAAYQAALRRLVSSRSCGPVFARAFAMVATETASPGPERDEVAIAYCDRCGFRKLPARPGDVGRTWFFSMNPLSVDPNGPAPGRRAGSKPVHDGWQKPKTLSTISCVTVAVPRPTPEPVLHAAAAQRACEDS